MDKRAAVLIAVPVCVAAIGVWRYGTDLQALANKPPVHDEQLPPPDTFKDVSVSSSHARQAEADRKHAATPEPQHDEETLESLLEKATAARDGLHGSLLQKAENGDADAAYRLGLMLGDGTDAKGRDGRYWIQRAHELGSADATLHIAMEYLEAFLDNKDPAMREKALRMIEDAAAKGSPQAMLALASLNGGVSPVLMERNDAQFDYWMREYARAGDPLEVTRVARRLADNGDFEGHVTEQSFNLALDMYVTAGRNGELGSLNDAAWVLATCQGETPVRLAEAEAYMQEEFALHGRQSASVDTLAAVYARQGDATNAVAMQLEAIRLVEAEGEDPTSERYLEMYERLNRYQSGGIWYSEYQCP